MVAGGRGGAFRNWAAALGAAVAGLLLGALGVVLETLASGISELPFVTFAAMMLPIHLAIGLVEGLATAVVVSFVTRARPEALYAVQEAGMRRGLWPVLAGLAAAAALLGGAGSWFASTHPDGLEWSIAKVTGKEELSGSDAGSVANWPRYRARRRCCLTTALSPAKRKRASPRLKRKAGRLLARGPRCRGLWAG